MKYLSLFFLFLSFLACNNNNVSKSKIIDKPIGSLYTLKYAKGFSVENYSDYRVVIVRNPWDTTQILQRYVLVDKKKSLPKVLPDGIVIRTPLEKVAAYSTIHCSSLNEIGVIESIKGVCESDYIDIPFIQNGVKNGSIVDLGQVVNPQIEKIIKLSPEAIFANPVQGQSYGGVERTGIPVIETPDYMEVLPLGRAEWIRFYSLFFDKEAVVDSLFANTENNYLSIKEKVLAVNSKPSVFLDLMYQGVWYVSGGDSFMSHMLNDAGASYVWNNDPDIAAKAKSFEQVFERAENADFWLIKYNNSLDLTYNGLENEYKPYAYFKAFKDKNIYECNSRKKRYYEDLAIHPDLILKDFACIFHPNLFPSYTLKYYNLMK